MHKLLKISMLMMAITSVSAAENTEHASSNHVSQLPAITNQKINLSDTPTLDELKRAISSIESYEDAIMEIEGVDGIYGAGLSQKLMSLGVAYQELEKYDESIEVFKRAIHVFRINEGLYHINQVDMIDRLLGSYFATKNWKAINDKFEYMLWLHTNNYGEKSPEMLPALFKLSRWHLEAYEMDYDDAHAYHLISALRLLWNAMDIMDANEIKDKDMRVDALRGITQSNYYLATFKGQIHKEYRVDEERPRLMDNMEVVYVDKVVAYIEQSYPSGTQALQRIINLHKADENVSEWHLAKAMVELGDWQLIFGKRNLALENYQSAWDLLTKNNFSEHEMNQLFGKPVALPDFEKFDYTVEAGFSLPENNIETISARVLLNAEDKPKPENFVVAAFDVTPTGRAKNIEIVASNPPDGTAMRSKVLRSIKVINFRPRFIEGAPVTTERMKLRFMLPAE